MSIIRRLAAFAGYGTLGATGGWFWYSRQSKLTPLSTNDYLFHSTQFARLNPDQHPAMSDICVREVPLKKIKSEYLDKDGKLVEEFCAGTFGGIGASIRFIISY